MSSRETRSVWIGLLFAAHATIAIASAQHEEQLQGRAGEPGPHRSGQKHADAALGFSAEGAFALLARLSQEENIKLRDVVERITSSGAIAADAPPPCD